jgi:hypothetical protein
VAGFTNEDVGCRVACFGVELSVSASLRPRPCLARTQGLDRLYVGQDTMRCVENDEDEIFIGASSINIILSCGESRPDVLGEREGSWQG